MRFARGASWTRGRSAHWPVKRVTGLGMVTRMASAARNFEPCEGTDAEATGNAASHPTGQDLLSLPPLFRQSDRPMIVAR